MSELHRFILKGQVIALYRSFQRAIRQAPPDSKGEKQRARHCPSGQHRHAAAAHRTCAAVGAAADIYVEVRRQFEQHRSAPDAYATKYLLSDGRVQLKQLNEMLSLRA
jgi:hypothetical protein